MWCRNMELVQVPSADRQFLQFRTSLETDRGTERDRPGQTGTQTTDSPIASEPHVLKCEQNCLIFHLSIHIITRHPD
jgi:hypothetical protein